eukprot:3470590-Alexandrium_andersonii.AAC.1
MTPSSRGSAGKGRRPSPEKPSRDRVALGQVASAKLQLPRFKGQKEQQVVSTRTAMTTSVRSRWSLA